jgi:hypothetical protein
MRAPSQVARPRLSHLVRTVPLAIVALLGAAIAWPPGADAAVPRLASAVDPCLLGSWSANAYATTFDYEGTNVDVYGGAGSTVSWAQSGVETDDYDSQKPWVGTYKDVQVAVWLRGTSQSMDATADGTLSSAISFEYAISEFATFGGVAISTFPPPNESQTFSYNCTTTALELSAGAETLTFSRDTASVVGVASTPDGKGYWTVTTTGAVVSAGDAPSYSGPAGVADVIGIAADPAAEGIWLVSADGSVYALGAARSLGSLPARDVRVDDIVAITPTPSGKGYWLVGADGGEFGFGDAESHGSLPGLGVHVSDIVGMVSAPTGDGYLMVGADGGVFAFGAKYHGSLPGLGVHVDDIVGILPTAQEAGYVLVGADGGAFVFGKGSGFYGSLPGRGIVVDDISGLALLPAGGGYWMVGTNGTVYAFGEATVYGRRR